MTRTVNLFFAMIMMYVSLVSVASAAPKSELWPMWQKQNAANKQSIDHSHWQQLLTKYLVVKGENNLFRYQAVSTQDKNKLENYIKNLTRIDPRNYNKDVQFGYWVNLYNALTVNLILDNYPVSSIKKLGGWFTGPWDSNIVTVAEQTLTLNDIEHRILRPIWKDYRIHYVVNCASYGCPNLSPNAITEKNKENELKTAATKFVNSQKGASIKGNTLTLSSIYDWYEDDFGSNRTAVLANLDKYKQGSKLSDFDGKIKYDYDWKLNDAR